MLFRYQERTEIQEDGQVLYRRRNDGKSAEVIKGVCINPEDFGKENKPLR